MPTKPNLSLRKEAIRQIYEATGQRPVEYDTPNFHRQQRRQWIWGRQHLFQAFARLAIRVAQDYEGWRVLFLERDALPLMHLTQRAATHFGTRLELESLPFNRMMLPSALSRDLAAIPKSNTESEFTLKRALIEAYVRNGTHPQSGEECKRQELLHAMILERAAGASRVIVVDTGYVGTICMYVTAILARNRIETDWLVVQGLPGSNAVKTGGGENGPVLQQEHCSFAFELGNRIIRDPETGRLDVERTELGDERQKRYDAELEALAELLDVELGRVTEAPNGA